ncbi:uncharacterized protein LOC143229210 [Tachypleus tridentatus]|uniref:uncharacterized protein LOC143229210 n=1 Tax=Tachypleus tridentatus TaxID=6853 RepID=UPI003FD28F9D
MSNQVIPCSLQCYDFTSFSKCNHEARLQQSTSGSSTFTKVHQPTITAYYTESTKYNSTHPLKKHIPTKLVYFIAGTLQSFSLVELNNFQNLMATMDSQYIIYCHKHLSTMLIKSSFDEIQQ